VTARNEKHGKNSGNGRGTRTPDERVQYGDPRGESGGTGDTGTNPAPYDVAPPGTPDDQVIRKGERERPGPTSTGQDDDDRKQDFPGAPRPTVIDDQDRQPRGQNLEPGLTDDAPKSENVWRKRGSADDRELPADGGVSSADV
jgi:hypothetical protein